MTETIKNRIKMIKNGEMPEGYCKRRGIIHPLDWSTNPLNTVLKESKKRNDNDRYGKEDVLSVSGEYGIVNQIGLLGRSYAGVSVTNYHVVNTGDIVYTKSPLKENPYGIIKQNKGKAGIVSTLYAVYNCCNPVTGQYLDYYFSVDLYVNNYLKPLVKKGAKNDMKVNNDDVLKGRITLPPLVEREKIAEILTHYDKIIKLKKQLIQEKRNQKKWLMQKLLTGEIRLDGFNGEWKKFKLNKKGKAYGGLSGKSGEDFGRGKPYIPYLNIFENNIIRSNSFDYVIISDNEKQNKVKHGDIFFTTSSETPEEVGMSSVYFGDEDDLYLNSFCFGYRLNNFNELSPFFAAYFFRSQVVKKLLYILAQGSTRYNLSKTELLKQTIIIPPTIEEQTAIANILATFDDQIDLLKRELNEWNAKKKSLMQLLLTGIVRVKI